MGRKKQPHYRVVVADSHSPRDGRIVENLGYYRPKATPARLVLDLARVDYWMAKGAEPSDTVSSLVSKARRGGTKSLAIGEPDLEAQKKRESDALAARRASERKAREGKTEGKATTVPQDTGHGEPAASSASDESAVEVMAKAEPSTSPPKGRKGKKAGTEDAPPDES
jgi:small subunit ribosomal protein S16